jgi:predicted DNA-binding antitoxin AbrB/MazE fold protein
MNEPIKAVFEGGVFRPIEPVQLPEGVEVEVVVRQLPTLPRQKLTPKQVAAALQAIADLPSNGPHDDPYVSQNHDHYLYGAPKRR